jgi:hypothetical protein
MLHTQVVAADTPAALPEAADTPVALAEAHIAPAVVADRLPPLAEAHRVRELVPAGLP